ncbi:FAD-dependent oxidoreductase, partial [Streptomyces sp. TRM76130]|nr:FAD-dependent oxidoreductase [Streptomyces sp. TRM76130]
SVTFMFNDSIATLDDRPHGIEVTFRSGASHTFDIVIGADGIHSHTRRLIFGPEEPFHHYLGACFAGFTVPNHLGLSHEGMLWNTPSQRAALY